MQHPPSTTQSTQSAARAAFSRRMALRWRRVRRFVLVRRRLLAAVLAGLAVLASVRAASLPPAETTTVLVAARDLPSGSRVGADDLTAVQLPSDNVPHGALRDSEEVAGRTLAAPMRRGEPLTDVRLVAPAMLDGYPGLVAAPVRVADPAAVRLLAVGDRVDLVAVSAERGGAVVVAEDAAVVAVPRQDIDDGVLGGAVVVVAVPEPAALALAEAGVRAVLSVVLNG